MPLLIRRTTQIRRTTAATRFTGLRDPGF